VETDHLLGRYLVKVSYPLQVRTAFPAIDDRHTQRFRFRDQGQVCGFMKFEDLLSKSIQSCSQGIIDHHERSVTRDQFHHAFQGTAVQLEEELSHLLVDQWADLISQLNERLDLPSCENTGGSVITQHKDTFALT
jgi:hypothetical protein